MLMSSDDGGVDHRVFVVRIVSQRLKDSPTRRSSPTARTACECYSRCRSARADPATAPPSGISKSPPQRKVDCPIRYCVPRGFRPAPPLDNSPPQRDKSPLVCPNPPTRCLEGSKTTPVPQDRMRPQVKILVRGGRSEIRTHGGLAPTAVFKTAALNHSAILP